MKERCTIVYDNSTFVKARASIGDKACVMAKHSCDCGQVHVANSRFTERVITISRARWQQLVMESQAAGSVVLLEWFPEDEYGDFAATFVEKERLAFESGILGKERELIDIV